MRYGYEKILTESRN